MKVVNNLSLYKNISSIKRFLTKYHYHSNLLNDISLPQFLAKYEEKRELNKILLFQETLSKILFHFAAYGAFARKEKLEHYMNLYINMKPTLIISCPVDTYSGYGARSRDVVKALIEIDKYDIKILPQRWGSTPWGFLEDHEED